MSVELTLPHSYCLSNIHLTFFPLYNHLFPTGCPSYLCHPCCTSTKEYWSSGKIWLWNYIHLYLLTVPTVISPKSNKCHHSSHKQVSSDLRGRGKFNSLWHPSINIILSNWTLRLMFLVYNPHYCILFSTRT